MQLTIAARRDMIDECQVPDVQPVWTPAVDQVGHGQAALSARGMELRTLCGAAGIMSRKRYEALSGGIFLIGLGILFLVPGIGFWPWILVVIGLAGLPASLAKEKGWLGWQGFFWLTGLAVLFASGFFWPGILILVGLSTTVGALTRESRGSPFAHEPSTFGPQAPMGEEAPPEGDPFSVNDSHSDE